MLRIAVQAKGRLFEETMALLEESDIKLSTTKRTLLVQSSNFPIEVLFLRDDDIPQTVATGVADLGVVGENEFMEKEEDRAILISSHISSDLETLCDDLYMIHDGKIILHEDTDVLLGDYALLKLDDTQYHTLDKQYLLRSKKESFGYSCLTDQKQYYIENYPNITIEKGTIDAVITMMIRGE